MSIAIHYLTGFTTEQQARDKSALYFLDPTQAFTDPDYVSKYRWPVIKHPTRNEWAMSIVNGAVNELSPADYALIVDQAYMDNDGWFPPINQVN